MTATWSLLSHGWMDGWMNGMECVKTRKKSNKSQLTGTISAGLAQARTNHEQPTAHEEHHEHDHGVPVVPVDHKGLGRRRRGRWPRTRQLTVHTRTGRRFGLWTSKKQNRRKVILCCGQEQFRNLIKNLRPAFRCTEQPVGSAGRAPAPPPPAPSVRHARCN